MAITLNIQGEVNGTFTLEDDGTPGNGISVLRRPDGTIFSTFVHPGDALTLISRAGQNIVFNAIDSFTTANITIGSLTVPSQRPDSISIGGLLTSGVVTLTANGAISEFGRDAGTDIIAGKLFMDAGSGIGAFNAIETQVSVLEAESVTGGINLANIGNLVIGGATGTADLRGLFTGTSGNLILVNQGSILLSDANGVESARSAGNLALTALGVDSDISSDVNRDALLAVGNISLAAGRDILFGRVGTDFDNDVRAGGSIFINAGRDFAIDGFSDMAADDQGLGTNGGISITAGRDILIDDAFGVDASIGVSAPASTGSIVLTTGVGGALVLHANSSAAIQGRNGGVTIRADRVLIENDSGINVSGTGVVTLTTASAGRDINLGVAGDGIASLDLSDQELDRISSANVVIGGTEAGTVNVVGNLSLSNSNVTLRTGADLFIDASISAFSSLTLVAAESILQTLASTLTAPAIAVFVDTPDSDPAGGTTTLDGSSTSSSFTITGGPDADTLTGNAAANTLDGGSGNDVLDGGAGDDTMAGGPGNDIYLVDSAGDLVVENSGEGTDEVRTALAVFSIAGSPNVENLTGTLVGAQTLTGNSLGNDITAVAGGDTLNGGDGNDTLDGGVGADRLRGGAGDDSYIVDNTGDTVTESAASGTDTVSSSVTHSLSGQVENLILTGSANINGTGNSLANTITGNSGNNILNGGAGDDLMSGGLGDDVYIVASAGDQVTENPGEGIDFVKSQVAFILGANIEKLTLLGASAIDGTGNDLNNTINGNAAANTLDGGTGADKLLGADGNDIYIVDNAGDLVTEASSGGGTDEVRSSVTFTLGANVENLTLTGNAVVNGTGNDLANILTGNSDANVLDGGKGNDTLVGGGGGDTLNGGLGNDTLDGGNGPDDYVFNKPLGPTNVDHIVQFVGGGADTIVLENAIFTGVGAGVFNAAALRIGTAAADVDDRIIYDPATGNLFFDSDGIGAAAQVLFAVLDNAPATLAATDFAVI